jgi:hypothetical protein
MDASQRDLEFKFQDEIAHVKKERSNVEAEWK